MSSGVQGLSPQVRGSRRPCGPPPVSRGSIPAGAGEPIPRRSGDTTTRVYPRRCGGACAKNRVICSERGLSPQVRGSRGDVLGRQARRRSIPAGAGEPTGWTAPRSRSGVYPRRCGGAFRQGSETVGNMGLSPQVRGSPVQDYSAACREGSIPAGAGEPDRPGGRPANDRVYPRRCGGAVYARDRRIGAQGLSPQVRGSPRPRRAEDTRARSIPAGAGEPPSISTPPPPRHGLSPQVRGSRPRMAWSTGRRRSIPAGAGEPPADAATQRRGRVYPRRCGGAAVGRAITEGTTGLSPQVRGSRLPVGGRDGHHRSIPAGAGEPSTLRLPAEPVEVYPRRCGGATRWTVVDAGGGGLSPQVRGSPFGGRAAHRVLGSIPAGAGEPPPLLSSPRPSGVYPRRCGGASSAPGMSTGRSGLSPQVRGSRN